MAQGAYLLRELDWEIGRGVESSRRAIVELFFNQYLRPGYDPLNDDHSVDRPIQATG